MDDSPLAPFLMPAGFSRPSVVAVAGEGRVVVEAARYAVHAIGERRVRGAAASSGRTEARAEEPVILVPGFMAGDSSLLLMARALRLRGFRTYRSHIRANVGCTLDAAAQLESRLESIAIRRESRVQVVGHSLGGMLARGIAVRRPDLVSGIVTMGSPMLAPGAHHLLLSASVETLVRLSRAGLPGMMSEDCVAGECARQSFSESRTAMPADVDFTAIYSTSDGIVDWRACVDPEARAVEVRASHVGMALDPAVIEVVAQALRRTAAANPTARPTAAGSLLEVDSGVGA